MEVHELDFINGVSTAEQLFSLYQVVSRDLDSAAQVHHMDVTLTKCIEENPEVFAGILSHCRWIETLQIDPNLLAFDPRIALGVCGLPELRCLEICDTRINGPEHIGTTNNINLTLSNLRSQRLTELRVDYDKCWYEEGAPDPAEGNEDPLPLLRHCAPTLEVIKLDGANIKPLCSRSVQFPSVTSLHLAGSSIPGINVIMYSFPNLRQLFVEWADTRMEEDQSDASAADSPHPPIEPWKELEYLEGEPDVVLDLGIPCQVHFWHVDDLVIGTGQGGASEVDTLLEAMRGVRVLRLHVSILIDSEDAIAKMIPWASDLSLTHLRLCLQLEESMTLTRVNRLLGFLISFSHNCSLQYLWLCFDVDPRNREVATALQQWDHFATATHFFASIPSLQFLSCGLGEDYQNCEQGRSGWLAGPRQSNGVVVLARLSQAEAEKYKKAEGMNWPLYPHIFFGLEGLEMVRVEATDVEG